MKGNWKELIKEKNLFKTSYCLDCQQVKSCGKLNLEYCCSCFYQNQQEKWTDYLTAEKALSHEKKHQKEHQRDLYQLAKGKTIENRMEFADWKKFYQQKSWGINLEEWLREKRVLPIDSQCAKQWREDKGHLPEKCGCLERKAQELHQYFTNCLERDKEKLEKCQCEVNEKVRVSSDYYAWCEKCEGSIGVASKKRVIKNRNDPRFWGLEIKERVLCGFCLGNLVESMPRRKKYLFWEYGKRGYWG